MGSACHDPRDTSVFTCMHAPVKHIGYRVRTLELGNKINNGERGNSMKFLNLSRQRYNVYFMELNELTVPTEICPRDSYIFFSLFRNDSHISFLFFFFWRGTATFLMLSPTQQRRATPRTTDRDSPAQPFERPKRDRLGLQVQPNEATSLLSGTAASQRWVNWLTAHKRSRRCRSRASRRRGASEPKFGATPPRHDSMTLLYEYYTASEPRCISLWNMYVCTGTLLK